MPTVAVPAMVAVPLPLSVKVIPAGRAPVSVRAGAGSPVVVTVKLKGAPTMEVAEAALVMVGRHVLGEGRGAAAGDRVTQSDRCAAVGLEPKAEPATVVPGGTVTGTLTEPVPVLVHRDHAVGLGWPSRWAGGRLHGRPGGLVGEHVRRCRPG